MTFSLQQTNGTVYRRGVIFDECRCPYIVIHDFTITSTEKKKSSLFFTLE